LYLITVTLSNTLFIAHRHRLELLVFDTAANFNINGNFYTLPPLLVFDYSDIHILGF